MSHPVIPAPARFDAGQGGFVFRPGMRIIYAADQLAPIVERFCSDVSRRTGLDVVPIAGEPGPEESCVRIELGSGDGLEALPAPIGLSPGPGGVADERYALAIDAGQVILGAPQPAGVARGLSTLIQLLAETPPANGGEVLIPAARILDGPRYAWRGLSLDVARASFTLEEVRRVVDLLALYKLNVLHLHLTDDQAWRLPFGRPAGSSEADRAFYRADELRELVRYAAERFVTVVPEVDTPGHAVAIVRMRPELKTGRNEVEFELPPGHRHQAAWLDPELPATFELVEEVMAGVAGIFESPYIHIGGDEPRGMPHDLYAAYVQRARDLVRSMGKRPLGWQESARAGLGADDVIQYWFTNIGLPAALPAEVRAQMDADLALSRRDVDTAISAGVPVIVSPLSRVYLDVPYADLPGDPAQAERLGWVGLRLYSPTTVEASFDWEPGDALGAGGAGQVAGVEAAIWAETISDFDDLSFLLLPRLAGVAQKAWSDPRTGAWADSP